jgi:hypothetical protein
MKCTIIPAITMTTGIVANGLKKNLVPIPGKNSIDSLKNTDTLATSHMIRKVLKSET